MVDCEYDRPQSPSNRRAQRFVLSQIIGRWRRDPVIQVNDLRPDCIRQQVPIAKPPECAYFVGHVAAEGGGRDEATTRRSDGLEIRGAGPI